PFFTCHRPREGIEGVLPDKGSGLRSPNQSPSIGINKGIKHPDSCRGRSSRGGSGRPAIPQKPAGLLRARDSPYLGERLVFQQVVQGSTGSRRESGGLPIP